MVASRRLCLTACGELRRLKTNILYCIVFLGMTLNCIHIFIVTGSFFVLMCHEAGQSAFLHTQLYLSIRILIISDLATFLGTLAFLC